MQESNTADRDWDAIEQSPEFQELSAKRRRLVTPLLAVFVLWYGTFLVLTAYAHSFMGESIYRGVTVGYLLALSLIPMTWAISWIYIRGANRTLDPLSERAVNGQEEVQR
jgi:uncharacterized membrane protein (DUF485 family)